MLQDAPVLHSFAAKDLGEVEDFYTKTLGINGAKNEMGILELTFGDGSKGMIYPKPDFEPATYTVLMLIVSDIAKSVDELTTKGVEFEKYDEGQLKTDDKGITIGDGPKVAWFKDPAGNILSLLQN